MFGMHSWSESSRRRRLTCSLKRVFRNNAGSYGIEFDWLTLAQHVSLGIHVGSLITDLLVELWLCTWDTHVWCRHKLVAPCHNLPLGTSHPWMPWVVCWLLFLWCLLFLYLVPWRMFWCKSWQVQSQLVGFVKHKGVDGPWKVWSMKHARYHSVPVLSLSVILTLSSQFFTRILGFWRFMQACCKMSVLVLL